MKKIFLLFLFAFICTLALSFYQLFLVNDGRLHIVFCNVGQGDAIFVRTPQGKNMVFDGGPNNKILDCLSRHMPFWEKNLDIVFMTHPHEDHLFGLLALLKRYRVQTFVQSGLKNNTPSYKKLSTIISQEKVSHLEVKKGDLFKIEKALNVKILGPSKQFLSTTSPSLQIGERSEFANLVSLIEFGNVRILLTGDSQIEGLADALASEPLDITVLQVPHHGSKTGLSKELLENLDPELAIISVGSNRYGHPNPQILQLLKSAGVEVKRTDKDGDVEIVTNGKALRVLKE